MWLTSMPLDSAVSIGLYIHCLQWGCGKLVPPSGCYKTVQIYICSKSKRMGKIEYTTSYPTKQKRLLPPEILLNK